MLHICNKCFVYMTADLITNNYNQHPLIRTQHGETVTIVCRRNSCATVMSDWILRMKSNDFAPQTMNSDRERREIEETYNISLNNFEINDTEQECSTVMHLNITLGPRSFVTTGGYIHAFCGYSGLVNYSNVHEDHNPNAAIIEILATVSVDLVTNDYYHRPLIRAQHGETVTIVCRRNYCATVMSDWILRMKSNDFAPQTMNSDRERREIEEAYNISLNNFETNDPEQACSKIMHLNITLGPCSGNSTGGYIHAYCGYSGLVNYRNLHENHNPNPAIVEIPANGNVDSMSLQNLYIY